MNRLLLLALLTACVADPTDEAESHAVPARTMTTELRRLDETPACELLPTDDSPCAHACDEDFVERFVPQGTCALFRCELADGAALNTGGCRP